MRIVVFTSNGLRHKFFANALTSYADDTLVVSECKPHGGVTADVSGSMNLINEHFELRDRAERIFFSGNDFFQAKTLPILHKEINLPSVYDVVKKYNPDAVFVFGSWIIKEPLLSFIPMGRFINLHLGLSPYYRGTGTNFWPFVNKELEYVGATILRIGAKVDAGNIITHVRPTFEPKDTAHTIGCKVIQKSVFVLGKLIECIKEGKELPSIPQWNETNERFYRADAFDEVALKMYYKNLKEGVVEEYIQNTSTKNIKLISLH